MNDRELLELAAKAAGLDWCAYFPDKLDNCSLCLQPNGKHWNPLTNDGDALRLAVKLGMCVTIFLKSKPEGALANTHLEPLNDDPYAATRRAIVRAAAEIGKLK